MDRMIEIGINRIGNFLNTEGLIRTWKQFNSTFLDVVTWVEYNGLIVAIQVNWRKAISKKECTNDNNVKLLEIIGQEKIPHKTYEDLIQNSSAVEQYVSRWNIV